MNTVLKKSISVAGGWFVAAACSLGAEGEIPALSQARRALAEGIPQVAIQKVQPALDSPDLDPAARDEAARLLAESLRMSGRREEALAALDRLEPRADNPAAMLLRAEILAGEQRWAEAVRLFSKCLELDPDSLAARIGLAESLQGQGRTDKAIETLQPALETAGGNPALRLRMASLLLEAGRAREGRAALAGIHPETPAHRHWHRYLEARLHLLDGRHAAAAKDFSGVFEAKSDAGDSLIAAAAIGLAEARIATSGYEAAEEPLETFLWRFPDSAWIGLIFRRLDQIYAHEHDPDENEMQKWGFKQSGERAALARYYLVRLQIREGKLEKAMVTLDASIPAAPEHRLTPRLHAMRADLLMKTGAFAAAIADLEAAARLTGEDEERARIELQTGIVHFLEGEFLLAATAFERAAERSERLREIGHFDAALAWLSLGNDGAFHRNSEALAGDPDTNLPAELRLEEGLFRARNADDRAAPALRMFLEDFPRHPRGGEARLVLAELEFAAGDIAGADRTLRAATQTVLAPESPVTPDRAAYLGIFIADAAQSRDEGKVIRLAEDFLGEFPQSPFATEVRMKLGQVYFRQSNFPKAEAQFETLTRQSPDSPYAETALFLAGESAMKIIDEAATGRALDFFDAVVRRDGPLKWRARQQQAIIQAARLREAEAVALYDLILQAQPPADFDLRMAAAIGKGDSLLALGRDDPAKVGEALEVFANVAAIEDIGANWRNQALYKKAKVLEQMKRPMEAVAACWEVLDANAAGPDREYFWYYRAGFDAARIFEQRGDWKEAIGVYKKIIRVEGPRTEEFRSRIKNIELEHFIPW